MDDFVNTDPAFFLPRALLFVVEFLDTIGVVETTRCVLSRMRKLVQGTIVGPPICLPSQQPFALDG
jgi:hypothetical protein